MTSTNWDVVQEIIGIGFNIACIFYFATADGKESALGCASPTSPTNHALITMPVN